MRIQITRLPHGADLEPPAYATEHAAGMDLRAAVTTSITITPGKAHLIPTGIALAIPVGHEAQIRPRSGLALRHGVTVLNTPGTIDADYRAEVGVILVNHGRLPFTVRRGDRIAQMVVAPVARVEWDHVAELPDTARGAGGFGSTGG